MKKLLHVLLFLPLFVSAETIRTDGGVFHCRVPETYDADSGIMVLFGGRDWPGDKTLAACGFSRLADRHRLFLLAPSFKGRNYRQPESGSGNLLKKAVGQLERRYGLKSQKLCFYGYSAGGECAALFYQWMPERVAAWGVHACGVYPVSIRCSLAPCLITCGLDDAERFQISRGFIYRYREHGGLLLWKYFPDTGHELSRQALELAEAWFDDLLSGRSIIAYGEDDTRKVPAKPDAAFSNPLYSEKLKELWRK